MLLALLCVLSGANQQSDNDNWFCVQNLEAKFDYTPNLHPYIVVFFLSIGKNQAMVL